jgi:hypothetical protein
VAIDIWSVSAAVAGSNPPGEGPTNIIDSDQGTKWLEENYNTPIYFELVQVGGPGTHQPHVMRASLLISRAGHGIPMRPCI